MKPLWCLHPALHHPDGPGERRSAAQRRAFLQERGAGAAFPRLLSLGAHAHPDPSPLPGGLPAATAASPRWCDHWWPRRRGLVAAAEQGAHPPLAKRWHGDSVRRLPPPQQRLLQVLRGQREPLRPSGALRPSARDRQRRTGRAVSPHPAWGDPAGAGSVLNPRPRGSVVGWSEPGLGERGRPGKGKRGRVLDCQHATCVY